MLNSAFILGLVVQALQLALIVILVRGKHYRHYPFFAFYTVYAIAMSTARLCAMGHARLFFVLYWVTEGVSGVLELLVLQEAFKPSLRMYYELHRWIRFVPLLVVLAISGSALWGALKHALGPGWLGAFGAGAYSFELGVRVLEVCVFLLTLKLSRRKYHPIGRLHPFGIVIGFGAIACAALMADLLRWKFGDSFETIFRYLPAAAYMGATALWLVAFAIKEPPRPKSTLEEVERRLAEQNRIAEWLRKRGHLSSAAGES
ncbi:MAG: hypothetical protein LAP21_28295 [Acidobacteriia bacterium]|nr:hypothetical protein [Terriglobia bacterium]